MIKILLSLLALVGGVNSVKNCQIHYNEDNSTCVKCNEPFIIINATKCGCPHGSYINGSNCSSCNEVIEGCQNCSDDHKCTRCSDGYDWEQNFDRPNTGSCKPNHLIATKVVLMLVVALSCLGFFLISVKYTNKGAP